MALDEKYPLALPQGTILAGQYVIEQALGQGGFGITYKAKDHKTGQSVAVKEFFPDSMASRTTQTTVTAFPGERGESFVYGKGCFLQEAETLAEFIGNENIVRVYSYFEENGTAYFVMEFIEGTSFDQYIKEHGGKVLYEEAEKIMFPVIDALALVHEKGIVHRDVTPDNIYITKDGKVKLLDFGAARYSLGDKSRSLDVVLKHGFAPKEQYTRHGRQGPYTDVYTVGASFYFAITGRRPPDSIDRMDEDELIPPSSLGVKIAPGKEDAILTAMSVQPSNRYQTMAEFRQALMGAGNAAQPSQSPQASTPQPVQQRVFTAPQPPVQPQPNTGQQSAPVPSPAQPMPQSMPAQPQPMQGEKPRKKKWILPAGIGAGAVLAVAVIIAVASSGGEEKKDPVHYEMEEPVIASNTATKPNGSSNEGQTESDTSAASAQPDDTPASEFKYEIYYGTVRIKGYKGKEASVVIPSEIEGQPVTEIDYDAFKECNSLTSVIIPTSVTEIDSSAFQDCSNLTSITIPDSVTEIGGFAFRNCSNLTSITIPDSVMSIGDYAFDGCSSLTSVTIPGSVTEIGQGMFSECSSLANITIPDSVTEIGSGAFWECSSLVNITIPDRVTEIGARAFTGCSSLTSVIIPDRVTEIGENAFSGCDSLASIIIPEHTSADSIVKYGSPNLTITRVRSTDGMQP